MTVYYPKVCLRLNLVIKLNLFRKEKKATCSFGFFKISSKERGIIDSARKWLQLSTKYLISKNSLLKLKFTHFWFFTFFLVIVI